VNAVFMLDARASWNLPEMRGVESVLTGHSNRMGIWGQMRERKIIENIEEGHAPDGRRAMRIDFADGEWTYWYVDNDAEVEEIRHLVGREVEVEDEVTEADWVTLH
jgi:hypothetical protein